MFYATPAVIGKKIKNEKKKKLQFIINLLSSNIIYQVF